MIVIASIHQPNWNTFALFDKVLLLAQGRTMYFGPVSKYLVSSNALWRPVINKFLSGPHQVPH